MQQPGLPKTSRRAATALIPHIQATAHRANAMPSALHRIERIAIFGSYLTTRNAMLGDLDIAVETREIEGRDFDQFLAAHPVPAGIEVQNRLRWPFWQVAIQTFVTLHVHITDWSFIETRALARRTVFRG